MSVARGSHQTRKDRSETILREAGEVYVGSSSTVGIHPERRGTYPPISYDFHDPAVLRSAPPPAAHATRPLLGKRRAAALRHRDTLIEDIMRIGRTRKVPTQTTGRR